MGLEVQGKLWIVVPARKTVTRKNGIIATFLVDFLSKIQEEITAISKRRASITSSPAITTPSSSGSSTRTPTAAPDKGSLGTICLRTAAIVQ